MKQSSYLVKDRAISLTNLRLYGFLLKILCHHIAVFGNKLLLQFILNDIKYEKESLLSEEILSHSLKLNAKKKEIIKDTFCNMMPDVNHNIELDWNEVFNIVFTPAWVNSNHYLFHSEMDNTKSYYYYYTFPIIWGKSNNNIYDCYLFYEDNYGYGYSTDKRNALNQAFSQILFKIK